MQSINKFQIVFTFNRLNRTAISYIFCCQCMNDRVRRSINNFIIYFQKYLNINSIIYQKWDFAEVFNGISKARNIFVAPTSSVWKKFTKFSISLGTNILAFTGFSLSKLKELFFYKNLVAPLYTVHISFLKSQRLKLLSFYLVRNSLWIFSVLFILEKTI